MLCCTWNRPRSQFVVPPAVTPLIQPFTVLAPAWVDTGVSGRFTLLAPVAGAVAAKVNSAICDGVPTSELVNVVAAVLRAGSDPLTEPDTSRIRATLRPHLVGATGLVLVFCQIPPDAVGAVLPVPSMNDPPELYVVPATSAVPVRNRYGVATNGPPSGPVISEEFCSQPAGTPVCTTQNCRLLLAPPALGVGDDPTAVAVGVGHAGVRADARGRGGGRGRVAVEQLQGHSGQPAHRCGGELDCRRPSP